MVEGCVAGGMHDMRDRHWSNGMYPTVMHSCDSLYFQKSSYKKSCVKK